MTCMAMPCLKNLCHRSHKINNFGGLFIDYHYYITHFHPCQGVEEMIFKYKHLDVWSIFTLFTLKVSPLVQVVFVVVLRFVKIKIFSLSWIFKYQYSLKLFSLYIFFLAKNNFYMGTRFVTQFSGHPSHSHVSLKIGFILTNL